MTAVLPAASASLPGGAERHDFESFPVPDTVEHLVVLSRLAVRWPFVVGGIAMTGCHHDLCQLYPGDSCPVQQGDAGATQDGVTPDGVTSADVAPINNVGAPFPPTATFYQDISNAGLSPASAAIIAALNANGWLNPSPLHGLGIDPSFTILNAGPDVARRTFTPNAESITPDCDTAPVPVPIDGKLEDQNNYCCSNPATGACDGTTDCHLIVYQGMHLYELHHASITSGQATGGTFTGGCLAVWDLTYDYWQPGANPYSRGEFCAGADAADLPIAPLVLTQSDITNGLFHAVRFTIPSANIDPGGYNHPATHLGAATGSAPLLTYGIRLRLSAMFDLTTLPTDGARNIARGLQRYGMILADQGEPFISATTDATNAANINDTHDLDVLQPSDFEVVDEGTTIQPSAGSCSRTPITN